MFGKWLVSLQFNDVTLAITVVQLKILKMLEACTKYFCSYFPKILSIFVKLIIYVYQSDRFNAENWNLTSSKTFSQHISGVESEYFNILKGQDEERKGAHEELTSICHFNMSISAEANEDETRRKRILFENIRLILGLSKTKSIREDLDMSFIPNWIEQRL